MAQMAHFCHSAADLAAPQVDDRLYRFEVPIQDLKQGLGQARRPGFAGHAGRRALPGPITALLCTAACMEPPVPAH